MPEPRLKKGNIFKMLLNLAKSKYFWLAVVVIAGIYLLAVRQYNAAMLAQQSGRQAGKDAALTNGYTTYNTSFYRAPWWFPVLRFSKANPYVTVNEQPEEYSKN